MSHKNEKHRRRYAEDPEYREKRKAYRREYYAAHKDQEKERQRLRSWARRLSDRWRRLERIYGISMERYEALLARQGGVCGICKKPPREPLCVDHSHTTGGVRGLLCRKCNTGLGFYDDDASVMAAGAAYLRKAADDEAKVAASAGAATPGIIPRSAAPRPTGYTAWRRSTRVPRRRAFSPELN